MKVDLYNEVTQETTRIGVTKNDFKVLKRLQYLGYFKRFGLDIYDEEGEREKEKLMSFLSEIFANIELVRSYFK